MQKHGYKPCQRRHKLTRARTACEVTRKAETAGKPDHKAIITCGEVWVFNRMVQYGKRGVTTRDFLGADLRHYIRNLKRKGIGIDFEWETDSFGRHKRWRLRDGHTSRNVPYPHKAKAPAVAPVKPSSPATSNIRLGSL